ncbi:SDR family NAD(P)-dependent oxidoreductase [Actinomadura sp. HBU206391]|uniref:SDR family NAD(P)-dependent oxidoreductase n=1 Tax=Actinomadura sp. HBU206391 TaxID=2731692 RepID=UPI0016500CCE|nr:SDR family oxidoreductase [Actinomadura sp. HBU206391]MBC6457876.1 SDR family oxidoreductase [Actinomadura sp. HBU206391]
MTLDQNALAGRTVLLTGASRGIGAVTARALTSANANVIAQYRTERDGAERAVEALSGDQKLLLQADLSTPAGARDLWRSALEWDRDIDVLVLNAAVNPETPIDAPDETWDAGWQEALQVNVIGAGALMREATRYFVARGSGTIIVLSSWAAEMGSRLIDRTSYAASKAAIRNLAQTFARNFARQGLRVYVLAPGVVNAGMAIAGQDESAKQAVADGLTMGRLVEADELASLVAFLATDACPSLTGATLDVNGASYIR